MNASRSSRSYCSSTARAGAQRAELAHRFGRREPMKSLARDDDVDARAVQARLLGGAVAPADVADGLCALRAHACVRLDRDDARAAIGEEPRRDSGPGADVGDRQRRRIAETVERRIDRFGRIDGRKAA